MTGVPTGGPRAIRRVLELVEPVPPHPDISAGYLDLSGPTQGRYTGLGQALMFTKAVPAIYERWWRPALFRAVKGPSGPGRVEEYRLIRALLELKPGDRVLDIACGPGNITRELARAVAGGGLAVGVDVSPTMLDRAVRDPHYGSAHIAEDTLAYVRGDAVELSFRGGVFDAVCCFAGLHLFADPLVALDQMARVLKPGGRVALLTSYRHRSLPLHLVESLVSMAGGFAVFDREEVTAALRQRGFADVGQRVFGATQLVSAGKS